MNITWLSENPAAEEAKRIAGSAAATRYETGVIVKGRELVSGMPRTASLTAEEIRYAIDETVSAMVDSAVSCLSQSPPELAQDIILNGIHLVGGGGLLRGMGFTISSCYFSAGEASGGPVGGCSTRCWKVPEKLR